MGTETVENVTPVVQSLMNPTDAETTIENAGNVPVAIPDGPSQMSTAVTDGVSTPTPHVEVAQPAPGIPSNQGMELILKFLLTYCASDV